MIDGGDIAETLVDLATDIEPGDSKNPWPKIIIIAIIIAAVGIYYIYK
jgi:hypothetical protein